MNKHFQIITDCGYEIDIASHKNNKGVLYLVENDRRTGVSVQFKSNGYSSTYMKERIKVTRPHSNLDQALLVLCREVLSMREESNFQK